MAHDSGVAGGLVETQAEEKSIHRLTVPESLKAERIRLERRLVDVNAAIEALEANPEIERVLHLLSKVTRL